MDSQQGGAAANNSSDFVRKLYKMLEDPSYESVVRWGDLGDSFVVLENERFTKSILPKHFKHSNFASFVRQLNKYDFHKVRHNNDENGNSQYGAGAWEFKHPDFKANNKDALDNIRRKAPVPRKPNQISEEAMPTQQMDLVNTQLVATQQQLQALQERYNELSLHHQMLLQEVIGLQKTVVNHEHVMQNVMSFLHSVDAQRRRDSKLLTNPFAGQGLNSNQDGDVDNAQEMAPGDDDEPASPLQNADKLLSEVNADSMLNTNNLEKMNEIVTKIQNQNTTPPPSEMAFRESLRQSSRDPPTSASSAATMRFGEIDVYPVGQTNGIDPTYETHIHNIPYPLPSQKSEPTDPRYLPSTLEGRKKNGFDPGWIRQPQILLVEDDPTCRRIGGKFLYAFSCAIEYALDGLEAVNKMNNGRMSGNSKYDLVLMDIIMPNLDGVSACHLIRQFDSSPIVAMTSNIRSDDISMYFQHGMNDVLPKPFTKDGLWSILEKHLAHLRKNSPTSEMEPGSVVSHDITQNSRSHSLKDEDSPRASPATLSVHSTGNTQWNSPAAANMHGPSPVTPSHAPGDDYLSAGSRQQPQYQQYMDNHHSSSAPQTPMSRQGQGPNQLHPGQSHRRQISDISGGEDPGQGGSMKKQHMYSGQSQYNYHQQQQQQQQQQYAPLAQQYGYNNQGQAGR